MGKIQIPKKIRTEDFDEEYNDLIEKIGYAFNNFADEVYQTLDGGIDFANMSRQLIVLTINMDSSGKIINSPQIKLTTKTKIVGTSVIRAINLINPQVYPTSQPFINFSLNGTVLTIQNITGLQNSSQYQVTIELIGG